MSRSPIWMRRLPIWLLSVPITAAVQLITSSAQREHVVATGLSNGYQIVQPWYAHHATLTRVHLATGLVFTLLGALQFIPRFRENAFHRLNGRLTVAAGGIAAVSGIWMNLVFPMGGILKYLGGYFFGVMVLSCAVLGVRAIRRGDVPRHRAWMSRAFAIAMAAGLQRMLMSIWVQTLGWLDEFATGVCLWSAAALSLAVCELLLLRNRRRERTDAAE